VQRDMLLATDKVYSSSHGIVQLSGRNWAHTVDALMLSQIWVTGNYTNNDHIHLNWLQRLTAQSVQFLDDVLACMQFGHTISILLY